ncbi:MAG TPA: DUF4159 domain-containing protein [Alphaproteobacteria bacterium]
MSGLLGIAFLGPFWLIVLAALPILWWLLRVTPPAPRRARFPAIRLLLGLRPREETPAQTPLWLLLLRLLIAALIILALAHPLLNPGARLATTGPVVIVIDDGWSAARNWASRQTMLADLMDRAERNRQPVMLIPTAPSVDGEAPQPSRLSAAADARSLAAAVAPKPWPVDREATIRALDNLDLPGAANVVYLADGLDDEKLAPLVERLQRFGGVEYFSDAEDRLARLLLPPVSETGGLLVSAARPASGPGTVAFVRALGDDGRLLAREEMRWQDGQANASVRLTLPTELRNRVSRLELEGEASAGAVVLVDERWRRRPVGLVSGGPVEREQPLLADIYYLQRALGPFAEIRTGSPQDLLKREIAVLILADVGKLGEADLAAVDAWTRKGGMVVRFAGPRMTEGGDDFVPVPLRGGGRSFGGAMSWAQPVGLAPFPPSSPFAGLPIPDDVKVSRQVLAEPSLDLADKTWARLSDGTPLVTADRRGDGWLVLVHTTATPDWSSLPMSGLFVEMLQRLVSLSQGVAGEAGDAVLPPLSSLDGFGRLQAPAPVALAIAGRDFTKVKIGPKYPPGYYGAEFGRRALNVSTAVPPPHAATSLPGGVNRAVLQGSREIDLKPWLLGSAFLLLLADLIISLLLRGLTGRGVRWRSDGTAALIALAVLASHTALAQGTRPAPQAPAAARPADRPTDDGTLSSALTTRLGYVRSGSAEIDEVSRAGLIGLGAVLSRRTAIDPGQPAEIDIEHDEMAYYPLLYWPVAASAPPPTAAALSRVNTYLRNGGMILFDTKDADRGGRSPAADRLRDILRQLNLPALATVPADHVLTKSFYLLSEFPGRWSGQPVWVEQADSHVNDGVSSVVIGGNDWSAAWATDGQGHPMFAAVPGGEPQRETALRFGVNLIMYALTGNYKADQVHVDAILDRLRR